MFNAVNKKNGSITNESFSNNEHRDWRDAKLYKNKTLPSNRVMKCSVPAIA
jgi:hypothetical protein